MGFEDFLSRPLIASQVKFRFSFTGDLGLESAPWRNIEYGNANIEYEMNEVSVKI